jgi:tetratricopeptide (TPR) repeat protein
MGKLLNFTDDADLDQLRKNAYARYDAGKYHDAIDLFEQYFAAGGRPSDMVRERKALVRLGRAYLKIGETQAAKDLCQRNLATLSALQFGRTFLMDAGIELPNFEFCQRAILNAFDEDEADLFTIRLNNVIAEYLQTHRQLVNDTVRRVSHLGGFPLYEQEQILRTELPRIPVATASPAVVAALHDQSVHPFVRTTLIVWARTFEVNVELEVQIDGHTYAYNPYFAKVLGEDLASRAVRTQVHELAPDFPDTMVQLMLGMVYPVAEKIIPNPDKFAQALIGRETGDEEVQQLVKWMNSQAQMVSDSLN